MSKPFARSKPSGLLIGRNPILETLKMNPDSIKKIIILDSSTDDKIREILSQAELKNIPVEKLSKASFDIIFDKKDKSEGISQGVAAEIEEFKYSKTSQILISAEGREKVTLAILDEIQDPHNFGAIVRSAAAAGIDGIIISEKNTVKVNHTVIKTSSGATNHIKISKESNVYSTIEYLKGKGYKIIGTVSDEGTSLYRFEFPEKCAIVFGGEGEGLRKNLVKLCDHLVNIPMESKIESLNVSVSAGVIFFEILRQKNFS